MADIYTHILVADKILENLDDDLKGSLKDHKNVFFLGAQGPDIFFYHRIFPWYKKSKLKRIGDQVHSEKVNDFFMSGLKHIESMPASDHKRILKAYFLGFMTHYAVDIHTHPYIFYYSGHEGGYNHKYYEVFLDTCMAYKTDFVYAPTHRKIKTNKKEKIIIGNFLSSVLREVFALEDVSKDISQALGDMTLVLAMLYDRRHIKRPLLNKIDDMTQSKGKIKTAVFPMKLEDTIDYLNNEHDQWFHPCKPHNPSRASFEDLLDQSVEYGVNLLETANKHLTEAVSKQTLQATIGNRAYDTGLDLSMNQTMSLSKKMIDYIK